jgi:hypothetical protein
MRDHLRGLDLLRDRRRMVGTERCPFLRSVRVGYMPVG